MGAFDDTSIYTQPQQGNQLLNAAQGYMGFANAAQENQLLGTRNQQERQALVADQVNAITSGFGALASDPNPTYDKFVQLGQTLLKEGRISQATYDAELQNIPQNGTPALYQGIAKGFVARAMSAADQFGAANGYAPGAGAGVQQYVGPDGAIRTTTTAAVPGQFNMPGPGAGFAGGPGNALTNPPPANALVPPMPAPASDRPQAPPVTPPAAAPALSQPAPLVPTASGTGASPAPPQPAASAPTEISGPTPAQNALNLESAKSLALAKDTAANFSANSVPIKKMIALFPDTLTGPGSNGISRLATLAHTFGFNFDGSANQASNYAELEKYAEGLAANAGPAGRSDMALISSKLSNPNVEMDGAAALDVAKSLYGLGRMQYALVQGMSNQGVPGDKWQDYERAPITIQQNGKAVPAMLDPRAFRVDMMSDQDWKKLDAEFAQNPAAKARFAASVRFAEANGGLQ